MKEQYMTIVNNLKSSNKTDVISACQYVENSNKEFPKEVYYHLATLYEKGKYVTEDIEKAKRYYEICLSKGDLKSTHKLIQLLMKGDDQEKKEAFNLSDEYSKCGNRDITYDLGVCLSQGIGTQKNVEKAQIILKELSRQNHPKAQVELIKVLLADEKTYFDGYMYCLLAAEWNNPEAQFILSTLYVDDRIMINEEKQLFWLLRSYKNGLAKAGIKLIDLYLKDNSTLKEAYELCKELSEKGNDGAKYRLAIMTYEGKYVLEDKKLGVKMLQELAGRKYEKAVNYMKKNKIVV